MLDDSLQHNLAHLLALLGKVTPYDFGELSADQQEALKTAIRRVNGVTGAVSVMDAFTIGIESNGVVTPEPARVMGDTPADVAEAFAEATSADLDGAGVPDWQRPPTATERAW